MNAPGTSLSRYSVPRLCATLGDIDRDIPPADALLRLIKRGFDRLPLPGSGATLQRWQALAAVASHDLSIAKLYEGHTDALAIMAELGAPHESTHSTTWGTWAAEVPQGRALIEPLGQGHVRVRGTKCWCSGAADLDHGLLTAWFPDGRGPQLVRVAMRQTGVTIDSTAWRAVGMADSRSVDVVFAGAVGEPIGAVGEYLSRPGFWQGGAGIAACWFGGASALGAALHRSVLRLPATERTGFRLAALGKIDMTLRSTAALLREAATWIDAHPLADASAIALRVRLAAERCALQVLDEVGRSLGAGAFCRDARFARMAADLPVFVRQSHAERDFAALGERAAMSEETAWTL